MVTEELKTYVKAQLATGVERNEVVTKLEKEGWESHDILEVLPDEVGSAGGVPVQKTVTPSGFKKKVIILIGILVILIIGIVLLVIYSRPQQQGVESDGSDFATTQDEN